MSNVSGISPITLAGGNTSINLAGAMPFTYPIPGVTAPLPVVCALDIKQLKEKIALIEAQYRDVINDLKKYECDDSAQKCFKDAEVGAIEATTASQFAQSIATDTLKQLNSVQALLYNFNVLKGYFYQNGPETAQLITTYNVDYVALSAGGFGPAIPADFRTLFYTTMSTFFEYYQEAPFVIQALQSVNAELGTSYTIPQILALLNYSNWVFGNTTTYPTEFEYMVFSGFAVNMSLALTGIVDNLTVNYNSLLANAISAQQYATESQAHYETCCKLLADNKQKIISTKELIEKLLISKKVAEDELALDLTAFASNNLGGGLRGIAPSPTNITDNNNSYAQTRFALRQAWNTTRYGGKDCKENTRIITPFRAVNNAGDVLSRQNYSCGGACQTFQSRPGMFGLKNAFGSIKSVCDESRIPPASCNVKYVYDGSDYTTYLRQKAINKNYNDYSSAGNKNSGAQSAIRAIHRF